MSLCLSYVGRSLKGLIISDLSASLAKRNGSSFTSRLVQSVSLGTSYKAVPPPPPFAFHTTKEDKATADNLLWLAPPKLQIVDKPNPFRVTIIDLPQISTNIEYEDKKPLVEILDPNAEPKAEKQAARMIVIRRKKMRVHKLKKWRKKFKFEVAKFKQRRGIKKEKEFQAALLAKVKQAERFDPAAYVREKLAEVNRVPEKRWWKGKKLPVFIVQMEQEYAQSKRQKKMEQQERRRNMNVNASDYP